MLDITQYVNQVICGSASEVLHNLPDECIDLGITSPPYNKKERYGGWLVEKVKYEGYKDRMPEEEYMHWQVEVLNELYRVTRPGGSFFYNHKVKYEDGKMIHPLDIVRKTKWNIWQEIIWNRRIAGNIRGWRFWQVEERIYWLAKGKPQELRPQHARLTSVWEIRPEPGHKEHPAVFPLELPARIIHSILDEQPGIVIDPFCGTGTTPVAAKLLGKNYIGIDISPDYVAYARRRLQESERERARILKEIALHRTEMTFQERKERGFWTE